LKASENEIFFVEDDVEPNTEAQFNDIPTKLELRTNDLCTHLINKSLLKEFMLIFRGDIRVLTSRFRRNFDIFCKFWPDSLRGEGVGGGAHVDLPAPSHLASHMFWPLLCSVDLVHIHFAHVMIYLFYF
jgi:hypothetical protein